MTPVPPVNIERLTSPSEAVFPRTLICCPGAICQRKRPPKALNDQLNRCREDERCGLVVQVFPVTGAAARAAVETSDAASVRPVPAETVTPTVESRDKS